MSDTETTAEKPEKKTPTKRKGLAFKYKLLLLIVSVLLMGLLRTGFLFIIIAMMPSIVAHYFDTSKNRYMFRSIFCCNLTGLLPYFGELMRHGPSSATLQHVMGSAPTWVTIYGASFIGWLLVEVCPIVAQISIAGFHRAQVTRFEHLQKKIETEWGPEVTQFSRVREEVDEDA